MDKVIFILGPTGVGKSDIAIRLAKTFDGEIISADSVQIYKGFDVGSAKITKKEMQGIAHHAIDICEPEEYFSVYDFVQYTRKKIAEINSRNRLAIVVGGTGLYIKSLVEGYNFGEADKHDDFRAEMQAFVDKEGADALWQKLYALDKAKAEKIEKNNIKRVIRALELCKFGGQQTTSVTDLDYKIFALNLERAVLYDRINRRVDIMVKNGLFEEVEELYKEKGIKADYQPMRAIGYKEIIEYYDGKSSKEDAIELVKQHSRNYAKRQLTFLRGMKDVEFVDACDKEKAFCFLCDKVQEFLK